MGAGGGREGGSSAPGNSVCMGGGSGGGGGRWVVTVHRSAMDVFSLRGEHAALMSGRTTDRRRAVVREPAGVLGRAS